MRLRHPDGSVVHLAYCTNVHPAEDVPGVLRQLDTYAEPVRRRLDVPLLGLGLWLAADVAAALAGDAALVDRLRRELATRGLEVLTLNGFPYRGFQEPVVKHRVYQPDWTDPARLRYTLALARILTDLLPDDAVRGSVSTLPLAWRTPWPAPAHDTARRNLAVLAEQLAKLATETGRVVRVGLEPEPGCVLGTTTDAVPYLAELDDAYVGICLDTCHLAVDFADPVETVQALDATAVPVVKAQVSAALHADAPVTAAKRAALATFVEQRFLHQTHARDGRVCDDLDAALDGPDALPGDRPWRVHFHIPLHAAPAAPLRSTAAELPAALGALLGASPPRTDHLEVETYTWTVLPERARPIDDDGLVAGIAGELAWTRDRLHAIGLEEIT